LAADTVSLLAAILLYLIAVGDVRGFAFFLGLSTLMDVFITWYFTRPLVILLGRRTHEGTSALSMAAGLTPGVSAHE
jgi:preprotein translocase subunit SecD